MKEIYNLDSALRFLFDLQFPSSKMHHMSVSTESARHVRKLNITINNFLDKECMHSIQVINLSGEEIMGSFLEPIGINWEN